LPVGNVDGWPNQVRAFWGVQTFIPCCSLTSNGKGLIMANQTLPVASQRGGWRTYRDLEPIWFDTTIALLTLTTVGLLAGALDERLFDGVSVWAKPSKFAVSLAFYFVTLLVYVRYLPVGYLRTGGGRVVAVTLVFVALGEMIYITVQGALGEASHFNFTTSFHAVMYALMGIGATWLVTGPLWFGWVIWQTNAKKDPMVLAIVVGLGLTCVLGGGFGGYLGSQTAHWVNTAATDANGIWLFSWSTNGGDLRVAHFFGIHAMQAVPLFAFLLPAHLSKKLLLRVCRSIFNSLRCILFGYLCSGDRRPAFHRLKLWYEVMRKSDFFR
jgi:hypothetical protein